MWLGERVTGGERCVKTFQPVSHRPTLAIIKYLKKNPGLLRGSLPSHFPQEAMVNHVVNPIVSSSDILETKSQLWERQWIAKIDEDRLRELLAARFSFQEGEWFKKTIDGVYSINYKICYQDYKNCNTQCN